MIGFEVFFVIFQLFEFVDLLGNEFHPQRIAENYFFGTIFVCFGYVKQMLKYPFKSGIENTIKLWSNMISLKQLLAKV